MANDYQWMLGSCRVCVCCVQVCLITAEFKFWMSTSGCGSAAAKPARRLMNFGRRAPFHRIDPSPAFHSNASNDAWRSPSVIRCS
jgi:hypothetical protein